MLSSNQAELLAGLIAHDTPVALWEIAGWEIGGHEYGENAARNALKRMEERHLVVGSGAGKNRTFAPTQQGVATLAEHAGEPEPVPRDSNPTSATRNYVVLEEVPLEDFDAWLEAQSERGVDSLEPQEIYVKVATVDARNTEHALRQAATASYAEDDAEPVLIPVAERMWQPEQVRIRNRPTISIG